LKVDGRPPHQDATLQVKVRELPTESTAKETTAQAIKQAAEKYKQESMQELQRMETDIGYFSNALLDRDVSYISRRTSLLQV
jgi:iron uptake system EfeUOB component EfeO/EfeM